MRKTNHYVVSTLTCKECGNWTTVPRKSARKRKRGHVKTMWCPFCKRKTDFTEE